MNKKGFVFIETIVTVVILATSLLVIYSSYSNAISDEKTRLYYNDPAYLYRTFYVRDFLNNNSNIEGIKNYVFNRSYITTIGTNFDTMFTEEQNANNMHASLEVIYENFNIHQIVLVDGSSAKDCIADTDNKCKLAYESVSTNMARYIKTLNLEANNFYLVVEYAEKETKDNAGNRIITKCTPSIDTNCNSFYVSMTI